MADISKIKLPSGTTYNIKDQTARDLIDTLTSYSTYLGVTTTSLSDGDTTSPITINGKSVVPTNGNIVNYGSKEFIFTGAAGSGGQWNEFGDLSALGPLAYVDAASGSIEYIPSGTIENAEFTGTAATLQVKGTISDTSITPAGTVSQPTFTGTAASHNHTFTGTQTAITPTITASTTASTKNYTPAGTVSKPDVTVTPTTTDMYSITGVGTLPTLTTSVSDETLSISFSQGSLPTRGSSTAVMTNATAALAATPTFTGTAVGLTASATYTPTGTVENKSVTPAGTVSQPTFTGTAASHNHTFTGTNISYTPRGTISNATFAGVKEQLYITVYPKDALEDNIVDGQ